MAHRRRNVAPVIPITIQTERPRARHRSGGGGGFSVVELALYGVVAYLLYNYWPSNVAAPLPAGTTTPAPGAAPTYWIRTEDGQVAASHTGPPSTAGGDSTWWGTWTAASPDQVQVALDTGDLMTYS